MTHSLVSDVLTRPDRAAELSVAEWDLLIRQARACNLLGTLADLLNEAIVDCAPAAARWQFRASRRLIDRHHTIVRWECERLNEVLAESGFPMILLKGAAYVVAGLNACRGRAFSDIDIMVPRGAIGEVEVLLGRHGWMPPRMTAYDERYYRRWTHEIPPRTHFQRGVVLDVHHTILPVTARLRPDPVKLLRAAVPIEAYSELYTLAPADMVLHAATHLFHEGESHNALRDLFDITRLCRQFAATDDFWSQLLERAVEIDLVLPLVYALGCSNRLLGLEYPAQAATWLAEHAPASAKRRGMDWLFWRGFLPEHPSCRSASAAFAKWCLYVRSHYLRMPLRLLIPHLFYKWAITPREERRMQSEADEPGQLQKFLGQE